MCSRAWPAAFYDKVVADGALMSFLRVLRSLTEHVPSPCGLMIRGHAVQVIVRLANEA